MRNQKLGGDLLTRRVDVSQRLPTVEVMHRRGVELRGQVHRIVVLNESILYIDQVLIVVEILVE